MHLCAIYRLGSKLGHPSLLSRICILLRPPSSSCRVVSLTRNNGFILLFTSNVYPGIKIWGPPPFSLRLSTHPRSAPYPRCLRIAFSWTSRRYWILRFALLFTTPIEAYIRKFQGPFQIAAFASSAAFLSNLSTAVLNHCYVLQ
jgi:hypothetical protein